jgi:hypothetical protein
MTFRTTSTTSCFLSPEQYEVLRKAREEQEHDLSRDHFLGGPCAELVVSLVSRRIGKLWRSLS